MNTEDLKNTCKDNWSHDKTMMDAYADVLTVVHSYQVSQQPLMKQ